MVGLSAGFGYRRHRFRDVASLQIDQMNSTTFFGGGSSDWATSKDEVAFFDDFRITAVPEPSSLALLMLLGAGIFVRRSKR